MHSTSFGVHQADTELCRGVTTPGSHKVPDRCGMIVSVSREAELRDPRHQELRINIATARLRPQQAGSVLIVALHIS